MWLSCSGGLSKNMETRMTTEHLAWWELPPSEQKLRQVLDVTIALAAERDFRTAAARDWEEEVAFVPRRWELANEMLIRYLKQLDAGVLLKLATLVEFGRWKCDAQLRDLHRLVSDYFGADRDVVAAMARCYGLFNDLVAVRDYVDDLMIDLETAF